MTQAAANSYDALLLDFASGALAPAPTLLVQAHLRLRPRARGLVDAMDAIGGLLLESGTVAPMRTGPRGHVSVVSDARQSDPVDDALRLVSRAMTSDDVDWRWRGPGLREHRLLLDGARLMKIASGYGMPEHGHAGEELTLVLRGAFEDSNGAYDPGDIAFADETVDHAPRVRGDADCVCLVVMNGNFRFRGLLGRIVGHLFS